MMVMPAKGNNLESTLEKVGRTLTERFGIKVICQGNRCCTDGKTIYLPSIPDDVPDELLQVIRGYTDHEVGHICGNTDMKIAAEFKVRHGPDAFFLLNILEDLRVEEVMRQRFPGSGHNLAKCYEFAVTEAGNGEPLPPLRQLAFAIHTRASRQPDLPFVDPEIYTAVDQIKPVVIKAARCVNTRQVAKLAEEAWQTLEPLFAKPPDPNPQPQQDPEPDKSSQVGDSGAGKPPPGGNTDPSPPSQSSGGGNTDSSLPPLQGDNSGSGSGTEPEQTGQDTDANTAATACDQAGDGSGQANNGSDGQLQGILGGLGDAIASQIQQYTESKQSYRVWSTAQDKVIIARDRSIRSHQRRMAEVIPHVAGVRQRLLQTLLAEPKARWRGDLEDGSINPRALYRMMYRVPEQNSNPRICRERVRVKKLRTAVTLLIDESASMKCRRLYLAANTALTFSEALSRLNISTSVIGFITTDTNTNIIDACQQTGLDEYEILSRYRTIPLVHTVYKRFDEQFAKVSGRMDSMTAKHLTPIGESMLFAARELATRHEERKVLFVLTDGKPVVGFDPEDVTFAHAKAAIKRIEAAGIDVALLGIMESSVTDLHHRSVVVHCLEDLPRTALRQLQKILSK